MKDEILVTKLPELRKKAKLTQLELSRLVGVTPSTIANWESGRSGLEWFERVARLCKVLNCTPEELLEYVSDVKLEEPIQVGRRFVS